MFQGTHWKGSVRFCGYDEPARQYMLHDSETMWFASEAPKYTEAFIKALDEQHETSGGMPNKPFFALNKLVDLPTFDFVHSVLIPSYHKLLEGVVQNFFLYLHSGMSVDKLAEVSHRSFLLSQSIKRGKHSSRSFSDPSKRIKSYTFEQLRALIVIYAPFYIYRFD